MSLESSRSIFCKTLRITEKEETCKKIIFFHLSVNASMAIELGSLFHDTYQSHFAFEANKSPSKTTIFWKAPSESLNSVSGCIFRDSRSASTLSQEQIYAAAIQISLCSHHSQISLIRELKPSEWLFLIRVMYTTAVVLFIRSKILLLCLLFAKHFRPKNTAINSNKLMCKQCQIV